MTPKRAETIPALHECFGLKSSIQNGCVSVLAQLIVHLAGRHG